MDNSTGEVKQRDLHWEVRSSQYVFSDRWLQTRADSCVFPDGRIIEPYYVVELPNWCNIVIITTDEKMVFVRQYRHALGDTTIELPGGVIDGSESPLEAAQREMREETGYTADRVELLMEVSPNPALNNNTAHFFLATNAVRNASQQFDQFEDIDVLLFSKSEVLDMLAANKFQHGVQIGPIYAALLRLGWLGR